MWTRENRGLYDRKGLRYPSDLSDPEWALIEPFIPPAKIVQHEVWTFGFRLISHPGISN